MCDFDSEDFLLGYQSGLIGRMKSLKSQSHMTRPTSRHQVRMRTDNFTRRRMKRAAIVEDGRPEKHPTQYGF
jgi:hypothetical protein